MDPKERKKMSVADVKAWLKRDFTYIVVCLLAIMCCLWAIASIQAYQNDCNEHWIEQINECNCLCLQENRPFTENFSIALPLDALRSQEGEP